MHTTYDAVIIGGGLAGCSLAIELARNGRRVILFERQHYPAHKLCGEFLSVEVQALFEGLGVLPAVEAAGVHRITRTRVTAPDGSAFTADLPGTALGLSRYRLDKLLADHARFHGATVCEGMAVRDVSGSMATGFTVTTTGGTVNARMVLGAHGKRSTLDRKLDRPFMRETRQVVAFKAHFRGIEIPEWIELHAFPGGYCGLSHVENGLLNACWIASVDALKSSGGTPEGMMEGVMATNPALRDRLAPLTNVMGGFEAISQITFQRKGLFDGDLMMVGDTTGMIAPLCGDGMAMALTGAAIAAPIADAFLEGTVDEAALRAAYTRTWRRTFSRRLRLGSWLHQLYIYPSVSGAGIRLCRRFPALAGWLIRNTRG